MKCLQNFFSRHPVLCDALRWVLPALVFGAALRLLLMSYCPYALWGADSRSYFSFAHKLFNHGWISLGEKRRYLYPILMVPVTLLPDGPLRWLPLLQHTFGLMTLVPLAYTVRKTLVFWRFWIVPITVLYAGFPIIVSLEHQILGTTVFFATLLWSFAGWIAWTSQSQLERARRMFWMLFIPFALFILTKPSGRFVWPGFFVGFIIVTAWRLLTWKQITALLMLLAITPTVGSKKQGAWLLYTATLPLTRLDTSQHAEYKAEIRDLVEPLRRNMGNYYVLQLKEPFHFLGDPGEQDTRPLWKALGDNERLRNRIYLDLAIEGIKARPDLFLYLGLQRIIGSANVSAFGTIHFADGYYVAHTAEYYAEAEEDEESPIRLAFALPKDGPIQSYEAYQHKLEPRPGSWQARAVQAAVGAYGTKLDLFRFPKGQERSISLVRPTFLAWWLVAGMLLSVLPCYRRTLGVWMLIAIGQLFGVFLFSVVNTHYFAPVWPVLLVLMAVPADVICTVIGRWNRLLALNALSCAKPVQ